MNLIELNEKLEVISEEYPQKIRQLQEAEMKYNLRFWDLLLHSGMGNQASREAEASLVCQEEGLLEPLQILRADVKALYHQKDCFQEISRNLRALQVGQTEIKGSEL